MHGVVALEKQMVWLQNSIFLLNVWWTLRITCKHILELTYYMNETWTFHVVEGSFSTHFVVFLQGVFPSCIDCGSSREEARLWWVLWGHQTHQTGHLYLRQGNLLHTFSKSPSYIHQHTHTHTLTLTHTHTHTHSHAHTHTLTHTYTHTHTHTHTLTLTHTPRTCLAECIQLVAYTWIDNSLLYKHYIVHVRCSVSGVTKA